MIEETELDNAVRVLTNSLYQYRLTKIDYEDARSDLTDSIIDALKLGVKPSEVMRDTGLSSTWIRVLARRAGLPPLRKNRSTRSE